MKWPNTVTVVRHGESAYNDLKLRKEADPTIKSSGELTIDAKNG